ncbi:MAG: thiamine phosphate synthase [Pyrinomonadaceae bacterium]
MKPQDSSPITYLITDGTAEPAEFSANKKRILETIELAVAARVSMVQIREKALTAKQTFELTMEAAAITKPSETKLIVNDRADITIAAGADGVHLPESGMPVAAIRKACPPPFIIGASVHSIERAVAAEREGADFLLFGPVFDSGEKTGVGLSKLAEVCAAVNNVPVIAIGGINASNNADVLLNGAAGFAAIRYLNDLAVLGTLARI